MHRARLLFFLAMPILSAGQEGVSLLRWAGPPGSRPGTYEEWLAEHPYTPFYFTLDHALLGDGRTGSVAILTELNLAHYLTDEIHELSENLQNDGYTVYSYQVSGGTPETLKTFLQQLYSTDSIEEHCLLATCLLRGSKRLSSEASTRNFLSISSIWTLMASG